MDIIKPPNLENEEQNKKISIFLAGTIDMGDSIDWQAKIQSELKDFDIVIYNPRRDDWDSSWKQTIDDPKFNEQVNWELDHIDKSTIVIMYLADGSKSPISLLELGYLCKNPHKVIVYCTDKFYRKGNVDIICQRNNIIVVDDFSKLLAMVKSYLNTQLNNNNNN